MPVPSSSSAAGGGTFLTCYKIKDVPKAANVAITVRNQLDDGLAVQTIKGDQFCVPSYANRAL